MVVYHQMNPYKNMPTCPETSLATFLFALLL